MASLLLAAWLWTPLSELRDVERVSRWLHPLREPWWGPVVTGLVIALAALACVPMTPMVLAAVLAFGSVEAFLVMMGAELVGALAGHTLGRFALGDALRRRLDERVPMLAEQLDHELRTTILMRMVPVAPFAVVNLVAGSARLRLRPFLLGTLLGSAPNLAFLVWASEGVLGTIRDPSWTQLAKASGAIAGFCIVTLAIRRVMSQRAKHWRAGSGGPVRADRD